MYPKDLKQPNTKDCIHVIARNQVKKKKRKKQTNKHLERVENRSPKTWNEVIKTNMLNY